jgi:hypothetical protein
MPPSHPPHILALKEKGRDKLWKGLGNKSTNKPKVYILCVLDPGQFHGVKKAVNSLKADQHLDQ